MLRTMCRAKIHRATVTEANLNYIGSLTVDSDLLQAAGILPYEMVQITNLSDGTRWVTYVIAAPPGSGAICLNGPAARHFHPGDLIIVLASGLYDDQEVATIRPKVVFVDDHNRITEIATDEEPFTVK